ncbi:MFS transporter [Luteimonas sp. FXH3W]|uniref:MFS transporter n=1 Tax=Aquilutibacter rugosus TaxID=3115820 RepID=A0ABU7UZ81_9GAMM
MDRFGKGIRGAPRDALIADVTSNENRGAAFGLRQSMDTVGAVLGPLFAVVLLSYWVDDILQVLWFAVIPAFLCVLLIIFGLSEPPNAAKAARLPITREGLRKLGRPFWIVAMVGGFLSLARFSEAFLVLRGSQIGMSNAHVPLLMVVMSLVYSLSAYPVGLMADRMSRKGLLALGMLALAAADIVLARTLTQPGV